MTPTSTIQHPRPGMLATIRKPVEPVGFYADVISDAISLENCVDREEAYSVMEALRLGAVVCQRVA